MPLSWHWCSRTVMRVKTLRFCFVGLGYAAFYWLVLGFVEFGTYMLNLSG